MDRTVPEKNIPPLLEPKTAGYSAKSEVTESAVVAVVCKTGARPCFVSETLTLNRAAPTSSSPNTRPRPQLNALVKNDAVPVVSSPVTETNSPTRVYVTDNDTEQRFNYLTTRVLDNMKNRAQRQKADNKVFRKGLRKSSGALSLLPNQSKSYCETEQLHHSMKNNVSVVGDHSKTHALLDSPGDTRHTVCDGLEHKAEYSVSSFAADLMNQACKTRGTEEEAEYSVTYFAARLMNHAGNISGKRPKAEHSMPYAIEKQSNQTGKTEEEKAKAGDTVPIIVGQRMSQGGKKGGKKGGRKRKANKKKAKNAEKDTNKDCVGEETQGDGSDAKEDKRGPEVDVRAHVPTAEYPLNLPRAIKHRTEAVEPVKVDGKSSDNDIKTMLKQVVICQGANIRHLSLPLSHGNIEQAHSDVQDQEAFQSSSDLSLTDPVRDPAKEITPTLQSARSLPSRCSAQQEGSFSNSYDQQPAISNNLDPPSISSTTSAPTFTDTHQQHQQKHKPRSLDDFGRGHSCKMSRAGSSRGRTGRAYCRGFLSDDRPVNTSEIPPFVVERPTISRRPHPGYQPPPKKSEQDNEASPPGLTANEASASSNVNRVQSEDSHTQDTSEASLKVKSTATITKAYLSPSKAEAPASVLEPEDLVKYKTIDSYFLPVARAPHKTAADKTTATKSILISNGHNLEINGSIQEVAVPKPLTSIHKARDVTDCKDEEPASSQLYRNQPQATRNTAKNVVTRKYFGKNANPHHRVDKMETIENTPQDESSQGPGGASSSTANATVLNPGLISSNLIGERNIRSNAMAQNLSIDASGPDNNNDAASPDENPAATSTVTNQDTTEHPVLASSSYPPSCQTVLNTIPEQHIFNFNVPPPDSGGEWDNSDSGWATKPWTKSILGPRIDYNTLPPYNFGKPMKKAGNKAPAPAEEGNVDIDVTKNVEPALSHSRNSTNGINAPVTCNGVEEKHLPPHLRSPTKDQVPLNPKGNERAKLASKITNEQQMWVPPHLRTPNSASPSQSKMRSGTDGEPAKTSNNPPQANMLKDITNTPRYTNAAHNRTANHTRADRTSHKDHPLSVVNNATIAAPEASVTTPFPDKGKGKAIALEAPIAGWNGQMPLGTPKWNNKAVYDNNDQRQRKHMQEWLANNVDQAVGNPIHIDVAKAGFVTGRALADGQEELSGPMDPELHKTYPTDDPFPVSRANQTSEDAAQKYQKILHDTVVETKKERRMWRRVAKEAEANFVPPPNPHKPTANIYIRPVEGCDMAQITDIYNHYIERSFVASERQPLTITQWRARWQAATDDHYAFLVAVQMNGKGAGQNRRHGLEVVVGFAYAEDHGDGDNLYRYTCEIQFWVHHAFPRQGVGKTLVDRMLFSLDPEYYVRCGTPFVGGENENQYMWGGRRIIKQILIQIPYPAEDDYNFKWQAKWLIGFDFWHVSTLSGIGYKFGKIVNVACLKKETGSRVAAGA